MRIIIEIESSDEDKLKKLSNEIWSFNGKDEYNEVEMKVYQENYDF